MKRHKHTPWGSVSVTLDDLTIWDRLFISITLAAVLVISFPYLAHAQTVQIQPMLFEINKPNYLNQIYVWGYELDEDFPLASFKPELARHPKADALAAYLAGKGSPMSAHADELIRQYHYRLIIGISFAESNFCKKNIRPYNCWGIGGGNPETYSSYSHAFTRANDLIQRYHQSGMTTPRLMRTRWVGWQNDSWITAVNQVLAQLEEKGL